MELCIKFILSWNKGYLSIKNLTNFHCVIELKLIKQMKIYSASNTFYSIFSRCYSVLNRMVDLMNLFV